MSRKFCMWSFRNVKESRYFLASKIFLGFFCPLVVIIACYLAIVYKIRKSERHAKSRSFSTSSSEQKIKTEKTIIIVILVFFFTWLPNHIFNFGNWKKLNLRELARKSCFFVISTAKILKSGKTLSCISFANSSPYCDMRLSCLSRHHTTSSPLF